MEKAQARSEIKRRIAALSSGERFLKSTRIRMRLSSEHHYADARVVMLFSPMDDEVDTSPLIEAALAAGKTVLLPKINERTREMAACPISDFAADTASGTYGILEPHGDPADVSAIDFCLVPARAFDRTGARLGRGAGYYDRFMADPRFRAFRCGIAFHEQILDEVPHEPHDLPVQMIVTDEETIAPKR